MEEGHAAQRYVLQCMPVAVANSIGASEGVELAAMSE